MSDDSETMDALLGNLKWFVLAFAGLLVFFFAVNPIFLKDLIGPFVDWLGLLAVNRYLVSGFGTLIQEYGLFLILLLGIFLWQIVVQGQKTPEKKPVKK